MDLKVGDLVAFKKYEDMAEDENLSISKDEFPQFGKVTKVTPLVDDILFFYIEGSVRIFSSKSIARVISDVGDVDINGLKLGDEVLVKAKIFETKGDNTCISWVNKKDVVKVLKRKEPEHFIVKEDYYGMYVNGSGVLITDKRHAKIFDSRKEANEVAADMHLNAWEVIPYE